jgi:hypothetical protein
MGLAAVVDVLPALVAKVWRLDVQTSLRQFALLLHGENELLATFLTSDEGVSEIGHSLLLLLCLRLQQLYAILALMSKGQHL